MGRIGDFFRKIGRGIKKAAGWVSDKIIKPVSGVISNPLVSMGLGALGPVGKVITAAGNVAHGVYEHHDKQKAMRTPPVKTQPAKIPPKPPT
jgi:hypothetical protein